MAAPALCVVILSYRNDETVVDAIDSLLAQEEPLEVVVSHSGGGATPRLLERLRPDVRVAAAEERRYPGAARNVGVALTSAPYVAFLAADCVAAPGWARRRLARHLNGAPAVASAVVPLRRTPSALASYVVQASTRMPHLGASEARVGVSYAREVLERHGPFPEDVASGEDTILNARLREAGIPVEWAPDVVTLHRYPTTAGALLADQYRRGRLLATHYASKRARAVRAGRSLAIPLRALPRARPSVSATRASDLALALPLVFAAAAASAAGTARGPRLSD